MSARFRSDLAGWTLALGASACGVANASLPAPPPEPRCLSEPQALPAIQEALVKAGLLAGRTLPLSLGDGEPLDADAYFGDPPFAIEWVSADDRARYGQRLPHASASDPLQIIGATGPSGPVQVLVLDEQAYGYEANALLVQRGVPGIEEAERRVRRDVSDFVAYARDQGARLPLEQEPASE